MVLVERHILKNNKDYYEVCRKSGLLYNYVLYHVKQMYNNKIQKFSEFELSGILAEFNQEDFRSLPAAISQQVIKQVFKDVKTYFSTIKDWKKNPSKYQGMPKFPKYKKGHKQNTLVFTANCFKVKNNEIRFIKKMVPNLKTKINGIKQVRLIPQATCYVLEVVYEREEKDLNLDKNNYLSIDLGLNNLATTVTYIDNVGFKNPFIINGKVIKSFNHWINKKKAKLQSLLKDNRRTSNQLKRLILYRNNWIDDKMHKISKYLIDYCIENNIGSIVIGQNKGWKNEIELGKKTNQHFVQIPHSKLIEKIKYKAELVGIKVTVTEESYTSKCDALALEEIKKHESYRGKRVKRGLFQSSTGVLINSDVNGSINILRKVLGNAKPPHSGLGYNPVKKNIT